MSASSSDSWILIALTILVVLLLFYLSKKMICNSYGSSNSEDSTTSPSSSATSTSTSFSDYLYHGGYDGRSSLDLADAAPATTSSNGTSPDIDDLAIDIADSLNCPGHHHRHHQNHHHSNHHYRVDNGCSCDNYNCNNNNNNHSRNNLDLGNSVMGNGRGMSIGDGNVVAPAIGIRNGNNNNRGMDFGGSPTTSSTTTGTQQQPILSPISIIAGPAFDRKTMLETQLRNQIAKIVQAEREIQRLVLLLSLEQRQGYDAENTMLAAARASLFQHYQRYPQFYSHLRRVAPPTLTSSTLDATTPMTSESVAETSTEPIVTVPTSVPSSNSNDNHNNFPISSQEHHPNSVVTSHVDSDQSDHLEYVRSETTLRENHQQQYLCHRHSSHHHHNENSPGLSDYNANPNPIQNPLQQGHQPILSCGLNDSSMATFHQQGNSGCNLCLIGGSRGRRMLMLRRMLLSPSSFQLTTNLNAGAATRAHGEFLARPTNPSSCDLHYLPQQPIPEPQSGFSNYSHNHQRNNYPHPEEDDDPPPLYEECIRSEMNSNYDENYNQNLHSNNFSSDTTRSSNKSQTQTVKTVNV